VQFGFTAWNNFLIVGCNISKLVSAAPPLHLELQEFNFEPKTDDSNMLCVRVCSMFVFKQRFRSCF